MKKFLSCVLVALMLCISFAQAQVVTVNNGTATNGYIPVNGYNLDASYMHSQMLIPAADLSAANGKAIMSMTFYLETAGGASKTFANDWAITLIETTATSLTTSYEDVSAGTVVYQGTIDWKVTEPTITFTTPFTYNGGNLLIDMHYQNSASAWNSLNFYGVSSTGMSIEAHGYSDPTSGTPQGHSPKITFGCGSATCHQPTDLTVSNITSTTADFSWMASGYGESQYQYVLVPADSTPDWTNATLTSNLAEFGTNLQPNTRYSFYVRSYCSALDQSFSPVVTFKTLCSVVDPASLGTIGFETSEGFVSGQGAMANCWTVGNRQAPINNTYIPYVEVNGSYASSMYAHSGTKCLKIYGAVSGTYTVADTAYAIMPDFAYNGSISSYEVHFYARKTSTSTYSSYNDTIFVGVMSDPSDWSTLQVVGYGIATGTTYTKCVVSLSNYQGTTGNIVFLGVADPSADPSNSRYGAFYIDDLSVVKGKATPTPTNVAVDSITMATVQVSFTSTAANNRILMATEAVADPETYANWTIDTVVTTNPATINVTPATKYWLCVQALGAVDTSFISNPAVAFQSGCAVITSFPWTENFDSEANGDFEKVCWTNEHVSGPGSYLAYIYTSTLGSNATPMLGFKDQSATTYTRVETPEFNIPTADAYEFQISVYRTNASSHPLEGVTVIVENNYGGNDSIFIPRDYNTRGNVGEEIATDWYRYTIPLPKAGIQRIELLGCNTWGSTTYMDNLLVRKTPTCFKVQDVAVRDNQTTQATIEWTQTVAAKYQVLFTSERINPDTLATVPASKILYNDSTAGAVDSLVVTGLTPATQYFVYVRGLCSDEMSDWSDYIVFRTACQILNITKTTPFNYGFENLDNGEKNIPCWTVIKHIAPVYSGDSYEIYPSVSSSYSYTGDKCWYYGGYNGNVDTTFLIMPEMTNNVNTLRLRFAMRGFQYPQYNDTIVIGVMVDPTDETSFVAYDSIVAPDDVNWYRYEFIFDEYVGPNGRIALKRIPVGCPTYWGGTQYYGSAFDDFTLDLIPTCKRPTDVAVDNITTQSATISWTATTASNYNVVVADASIDPAAMDSAALTHVVFADSTAADTMALTGLNSLTNYYVYVQANCGAGDYSEFTNGYMFTTTAALPYVQYISGNDRPADMSWYVAPTNMDSVIAGVETIRAIEATSSSWLMNSYIGVDTTTLKLNLYCSSSGAFATPILEFNGTDSVELSFDVCKRAYNSSNVASDEDNYDDYFYVLLADPTMTQYTMLASWGNDTTGKCDYSLRNDLGKDFTHISIDMSELQGAYRILFAAGSVNCNDDYDLHIDNIMIGTPAEVVAVPNDTARGVVTGSCQTVVGAKVPLVAYPNDGFIFYQWSDGVTSNFNIYTVASENDTVVAYFLKDSVDWVITSNDENMGTVTGSGRYAALDTVTITATANDGFRFVAWSDGEIDAVRTFLAVEDFSLVATFEAIPVYTVTVNVVGAGTVTGDGQYQEGSTVTLVATPADGSQFAGWSNGETGATLTFTITSDTTFTATFEAFTGVENVEAAEYVAYAEGSRINVVGAENHAVAVIDATGRVIANVEKANRDEHFTVNVPGVYFIRVNGMKSTSVVVK